MAVTQLLVTGANGFVGMALCRLLIEQGYEVTGLVRGSAALADGATPWRHAAPDFDGIAAAWPRALAPDCVIHLAARVHVMNDGAADPLAAFRGTNVEGTLRVARAAHRRGARRFVFVSSIKAVSEADRGMPLNEASPTVPSDPYGRSKLEAELALRDLGAETGLDVVIVRPPLVYGPGVRANFLSLLNLVQRGIPLPFGAVRARRSLVYSENLADALARCAVDPRAAEGCFHVADAESPSVSELLVALGRHMQRPARLVPVPVGMLRMLGTLSGRSEQIRRLTESLQVDASRLRSALDWTPPFSLDQGLAQTVRWYKRQRGMSK